MLCYFVITCVVRHPVGLSMRMFIASRGGIVNKKVLWTAVICLLAGVAVLFYYPVREWYKTAEQRGKIEEFRRETSAREEDPVRSREEAEELEEPEKTEGPEKYPELYQDVLKYNREIFENGQENLRDAWSYEQPAFELKSYGLESEVFGVLSIPAMNVELPLYLGASEENMTKGAVVLGQTSIPVGQESSNSVIAAHRGYRGVPMFQEIEKLSVGDQVKIRNPWRELVYLVSEIRVIKPEDIEAVRIREGTDMITLVTCHPYTSNEYRYIVYCIYEELTDEDSRPQEEEDSADTAETDVSGKGKSQVQMRLERFLPIAAIPLIIAAVMLIVLPGRKKVTEEECQEEEKSSGEG